MISSCNGDRGQLMRRGGSLLRRFHYLPVAGRRRSARYDDAFYAFLLESSGHLRHLLQILAHLLVSGLCHNPFLASKFVHCCSSLGLIGYARKLFDRIPHPNIFLWNAILKLHSHHGHFHEVLRLYNTMRKAGETKLDGFTLPLLLRSCSGSSALDAGRAIHAQVFKHGFEFDVFAQNGLVDMYAKCKELESALMVFHGLSRKNVVSWTVMASGYLQSGIPLVALQLFHSMRSSSAARLDFVSLVSILKAYTDIHDLQQGRSVHGCAIKIGLEGELDVQIMLTAMYAKCGDVAIARSLFDQVSAPSVILWNAMICGYAKKQCSSEAVELFRQMVTRGMPPDSITLRAVIMACSKLGSLEAAQWIEDYTSRSDYRDDVLVNTSLIDMYGKCSCMESAFRIFEQVPLKDVVVWSAVIMGYGINSCAYEAINLFNQMVRSGVRPNDVTFLGLLLGCSHTGLVREGWMYFCSMKDYGILPQHKHYACMVDLLSRAGHLRDAFELITNMPMEPTISIWGSLLSACNRFGDVALGSFAAECVFSLDPSNAGHRVQLSNLYASSGLWNDAIMVRSLMKDKGVIKLTGSSFS